MKRLLAALAALLALGFATAALAVPGPDFNEGFVVGRATITTASGATTLGSVLSCSTLLTSPTYTWTRDGSAISGATSSTYTVASADQGHTLACAPTGIVASGPLVIPAAYSGPLDQTTATAAHFYGFRAGSLAIATARGKLFNVKNTGGGVSCDFTALTATGGIGNSSGCSSSGSNGSTLAAFCASGCTVETLYDQVGTFDLAAVGAVHPALTLNCQNNQPCVAVSGSNGFWEGVGGASPLNQAFGASLVFNRTVAANNDVLFGNASSNCYCGTTSTTTNQLLLYFGASHQITAANSAWHAVELSANGASSVFNTDGSSVTANAGTSWFPGTYGLSIGSGAAVSPMTGSFLEAALWSTGPTANELNAVCHSQNSAYALGLPC